MSWSVLVLLSCLCFVALAWPDRRMADVKITETKKSVPRYPRAPSRRLVLVDDCSGLGSTCHPLQLCCGGFKCKYQTYLPPKGYCMFR